MHTVITQSAHDVPGTPSKGPNVQDLQGIPRVSIQKFMKLYFKSNSPCITC